jgi:septum formation protein
MNKKIILASTSPRRKELLAKTGLQFDIIAGNYEEDMTLSLPPMELAKFLSKGKAESVAKNHPGIIIGADTFIAFENKVLGKPHTPERARETLSMLRGKQHSVITGYAVIDTETGKVINDAVETKVFFRNYSDEEMDAYIATGEPLDKAAAYAIQSGGAAFVEKIEGDYDSIVGLPVANIIEVLKGFGVAVNS